MKYSSDENVLSLMEWCSNHREKSAQFLLWDTGLELELLLLKLVCCLRLSDFELYFESVTELIPGCFALDHDLLTLEEEVSDVYQLFLQGFLSVNKTQNPFTMISHEHNHEQENKKVKGPGRMLGLTEDDEEVLQFCVTNSEKRHLIHKFEQSSHLASRRTNLSNIMIRLPLSRTG